MSGTAARDLVGNTVQGLVSCCAVWLYRSVSKHVQWKHKSVLCANMLHMNSVSKTLENICPLLPLVTFEGYFVRCIFLPSLFLGGLLLKVPRLPPGWETAQIQDVWMVACLGWWKSNTIVEWQWCFLMQHGFIYKAVTMYEKEQSR